MKKKPIKICLVVSSMQNSGGMERAASQLLNYFSTKENVEVHLVVLIQSEIFYNLDNKIYIHQPSFNHKDYSRAVFTTKISLYLRKTVKKIKPDSVLSLGEIYNLFVLISLLFSNIKVFISDRCSPESKVSKVYSFFRFFIYRTAHGIVSQTNEAKESIFSYTKHNNITVIPNPIKRFVERNEVKRENVILNIGRLVSSKQQDVLMRIFAQIGNSNWRLVFLGDGDLKDNYIQYAKDLGIENLVSFKGSNQDIENHLAKSKIFAFTSNSEGFPNALGEALLFPLASISFDCVAGPKEMIVNGENGFLIPLNNEELYMKKLKLMMENTDLRHNFEKKALKDREKYKVNDIGQRYFDFITI